MAVPTTTLLTIVQSVADNLQVRESGIATGGTTGTLICASYPYKTSASDVDENEYVHDEIRPNAGAAGAIGVAKDIKTYAAATGTFTPGSDWAAAPADTNTFDIFRRGITFSKIKDAVNKALRRMQYVAIYPLSLVTDGDMETSGTGSWTAADTTHTKVVNETYLMRGTQASKLVNTGANGCIKSASINVESNTSYYLESIVRAGVGQAKLIAYDVTNSADIDSDTWDYIGPGKISFTFQVPSTCEQIAIWLSGVGASDETYWDNVINLRVGSTVLPLPDWITQPSQVQRVLEDRGRDVHDEGDFREVEWWRLNPDTRSPLATYNLQLGDTISGPIWIQASRPFAALSADTDTTYCDREWIEEAATVMLLKDLVNRSPGWDTRAWKEELKVRARNLAVLNANHMPEIKMSFGFTDSPRTPVPVV